MPPQGASSLASNAQQGLANLIALADKQWEAGGVHQAVMEVLDAKGHSSHSPTHGGTSHQRKEEAVAAERGVHAPAAQEQLQQQPGVGEPGAEERAAMQASAVASCGPGNGHTKPTGDGGSEASASVAPAASQKAAAALHSLASSVVEAACSRSSSNRDSRGSRQDDACSLAVHSGAAEARAPEQQSGHKIGQAAPDQGTISVEQHSEALAVLLQQPQPQSELRIQEQKPELYQHQQLLQGPHAPKHTKEQPLVLQQQQQQQVLGAGGPACGPADSAASPPRRPLEAPHTPQDPPQSQATSQLHPLEAQHTPQDPPQPQAASQLHPDAAQASLAALASAALGSLRAAAAFDLAGMLRGIKAVTAIGASMGGGWTVS